MVIDPNDVTICLNDTSRIIKKIVGIHDANIDLCVFGIAVTVPIRTSIVPVGIITKFRMTSNTRPYLAVGTKVVEHTAELVVAGFGGHEVVEPGDFVKWRDGASVIRRNARTRVANQEGEV